MYTLYYVLTVLYTLCFTVELVHFVFLSVQVLVCFVTTIVTGAVSIYKPFTLTQRPFMRDVIFYIFAVYLTFFVLWTNTVELYQAISK